MQTLGLIETKGLIPAIISADAMLKSANISLLDKTYIGGGLVTISITGDVSAVRAAVDVGSAAVRNIGEEFLVSEHVIARPHGDLQDMLMPVDYMEKEEELKIEEVVEVAVEEVEIEKKVKEAEVIGEPQFTNPETKEELDKIIKESGIDKGIDILKELKVVELRNLARKYDDFKIKGREISRAGKQILIKEFEQYYK